MQRLRFSIRLTVVSIFVIATLLTAAAAIGLQYHFSRQMAVDAALAQYRLSAARTRDYLSAIDTRASESAALLARFPNLLLGPRINPEARGLFAEVMQRNPLFYAIYVAFPDGSLYQLVNLEADPAVRMLLKAMPADRWAVIQLSSDAEGRFRSVDYYDAAFEKRSTQRERSAYDPRERTWFKQAGADKVEKSPPYLFQHLQAPGQTYSTVVAGSGAVLAVDIALSSLSAYLNRLPVSHDGELFIYSATGDIVAGNRLSLDVPPLAGVSPLPLTEAQRRSVADSGRLRVSNEMDWPPIDYAVSGQPKGYAIDLINLLAQMTGLQVEFVNGYSWPQLVELFKKGELDILQPLVPTSANRDLGLFSAPIISLPPAVATRDDVEPVTSLTQLNGKVLAIPAGWSSIQAVRAAYPQITVLETGSVRESLVAVLNGTAHATLDSAAILRFTANQYFLEHLRFNENLNKQDLDFPDQLNLLVHKHHAELLDILNQALAALSPEQLKRLESKWFGNGDAQNAVADLAVVPYPQILPQPDLAPGGDRFFQTDIAGQEHFIYLTRLHGSDNPDEYFAVLVPIDVVLTPSLQKVAISAVASAFGLLLLLPVSWLFASPIVRPIKSLAQENQKIQHRDYQAVRVRDSAIIEIDELSHSIGEMAAAMQQHEREQKELMESIIRLIAQAIDDKSPYTAGHCARVPQLALMIAQAAERATAGAFKDFRFQSEDERTEFRIAAWLHDCGKITTPEHIVDKASKLETIYNRIHEVRMRFEVLWRDAQIDYLTAPSAAAALRRDEIQARLQEDFAFVARTNLGGEHLDASDIARLQTLANTTWLRHFDDRLGLSAVELQRYPTAPASLPTQEPLLADKPEHWHPRLHHNGYEAKFGIRMPIPELLYNQGELYNLSVSRGTLTAEDRFKINEHMISTIKMLESLPFPKELAKVARYASTHHETLIGTGYPRCLTAEDLSIPERMLAVADIFEALTAADRPYKTPKRLSEALAIMRNMVLDRHIDAEVFRFFLTSGVYLEYGWQFLHPDQLDCADISGFLDFSALAGHGDRRGFDC
ncbi:HD domain-containing phosphohydrolase [Methylomonas sp. HYX-M1]|uniref:HD domain-containing phosphohydrolase n=1 Tax=Methylomonas sp. HYX-M1 TaxID=3139307 RepID=UPI00345BDFCB